MNTEYFFSLYLRNIKGTFFNGFVSTNNFFYMAPFIWLSHIALLPITLTLGALTKTIVDCYTRNYTRDDNVLSSVHESIKNMDNEEMKDLIQELDDLEPESCCSYKKYSSNSSRWLFERLSTNEQKIQDQLKLNNQHFEDAMSTMSCHENISISEVHQKYSKEYLAEYAEKNYIAYGGNKIYSTKKAGFTKSKSDLLNYMENTNNNGKNLFQRVVAFFSTKSAQPVNNEETLLLDNNPRP